MYSRDNTSDFNVAGFKEALRARAIVPAMRCETQTWTGGAPTCVKYLTRQYPEV